MVTTTNKKRIVLQALIQIDLYTYKYQIFLNSKTQKLKQNEIFAKLS